MSRTHLQDPKFIATLLIIIDRKFQGFLSHCTNALTADDVRKFTFNFEPKERIAKQKTKSGRRYYPSS